MDDVILGCRRQLSDFERFLDVPERMVDIIADTASSLVKTKPSSERLGEVFTEFFSDFEGPHKSLIAGGIVATLCELNIVLRQHGHNKEAGRARRSLLVLGNSLKKQAKTDFELGVQSLAVIKMPLFHPEERVRNTFAEIYDVLEDEKSADTDEKRLLLAVSGRRAIRGAVPFGVDLSARNRLEEKTQETIISLGRKIYEFDPEIDALTPEMLTLLVGAIHFGRQVAYIPEAGFRGVFELETSGIKAGKVDEMVARGEAFAVPDMARQKLKKVLMSVEQEDEDARLNFADLLVRTLPTATSFTAMILTGLFIEGDPYPVIEEGQEIPSPLAAVLELAARDDPARSRRAKKILKRVLSATLETLLSHKGRGFSFRNLIFQAVILRDYSLQEKEILIETFLPMLGAEKPLNWQDLIPEIEKLGGHFILSIVDGVPYLFPSDERSIEEQVAEIEVDLKQDIVPGHYLWKGEYPEPEEEPVEVAVGEVVVFKAPAGEVVEKGAEVVPPVLEEEGAVEDVRLAIEIEDSPELSVEERLYRFLKRLERDGVIRDMDENEIWQMVEETDKLWQRITPFGPPQRTHTFDIVGTKLLLKKLTRMSRPSRALIGNEIPRIVLWHGPETRPKNISDIWVDLVVAEDLVIKLALDISGNLVPTASDNKIASVFFESILRKEELPLETQTQLAAFVIRCAHTRLIRKKREDLVDGALGVAARSREILPEARVGQTGRKRMDEIGVRPKRLPRREKVIVHEEEDVYRYIGAPTNAQMKEITEAYDEGKTVEHMRVLTKEELLKLRVRYKRGGLFKRTAVKGVGQPGGIVWLPYYLAPDPNKPNVLVRTPKIPSLDALERAAARSVDLWMLEIIIKDKTTGDEAVVEVFSTFRRASIHEPTSEPKTDP